MKLSLFKLIVLLFCPVMTLTAQDQVNMKFGKPTKEEMQMTVYEAEPDADAVVLCRLTDVEYTVQTIGYLVDYREKVRVKVLKPNGARFAKVVVPYKKFMSVGNNVSGLRTSFMAIPMNSGNGNTYFEDEGSMSDGVFGTDGDESVEDIKATAFNLENGKVVKTSLKKSDVVWTKVDEHHFLAEFTVPNVKEGTVVEYEYRIHSQLFWELRDWYAQCEIPVVYAKLDMNIPNFLIFNIEDHGIQRLTYTCTVGTLKYKVESDPLASPMSVSTNHYVYIGRDLAGMPKDDYVWNVQDYCAGITAELRQYRLRGMNQMDYARTWEQIDEMILNSDDLGLRLNDRSPLAAALKEAGTDGITDLRERVAAVCRVVMDKVKWNGKYELCPAPTAETLQKGEGTNADINLLLIQSLRDAGLTAAPVLLRSRDQGQLPYNFPTISKLTTFVVGVILPTGGRVYIDASTLRSATSGDASFAKNSHPSALPDLLLVERARMVQKGKKGEWVNLQKVVKLEQTVTIDAQLAADGTLTGKQLTSWGPVAVSPFGGRTAGAESDFALKGEVTAGQISFCPFPDGMLANPFTAETRRMPVEFPHTGTRRIVANIVLPEGYALDGSPRNAAVSTPDKSIEGRIRTTLSEGRIQMSCQLTVNKITHSEKDYADLRQLFDMLSTYSLVTIKKRPTNP